MSSTTGLASLPGTIDELPADAFDFGDESLGSTVDLHDLLSTWRGECPLRRVELFGMPAVLLLSYEAVADAFRDERTLPAAPGYIAGSANALGPFISTFGGDDHRVRRAILSQPFRRRVVPQYLGLINEVATRLVDDLVAKGSAELVTEYTKRFPLQVISRMLGLPPGRDDAEMAKMALDLIRWNFDPDAAMAAKAAYVELVTPLIEQRRADPGDDLISLVVTTEFEGHRLDDEETQAFVRHLFPAGADTTLLGLGNVLSAQLTRPDLMALARSRPDSRTAIIEEVLRWDAPVANLPRMTPFEEAVTWHGLELPPATWLIYSIMSANRDGTVFDDADRLDPQRRPTAAPLTFGLGSHLCVGNHLAMAEMRAGLDALLDRASGLALQPGTSAAVVGTILRGPESLPVLL